MSTGVVVTTITIGAEAIPKFAVSFSTRDGHEPKWGVAAHAHSNT